MIGAAGGVDPTSFAAYGPVGLVVVGFLVGWIWPKPSVDRLLKELERKDAQIEGLLEVNEQKVIPTLVEVNEYLRRKKGEG